MAQVKLTLTTDITFAGVNKQKGDTITVADDTAQWLIDQGAAEPVETTPPKRKSAFKPKTD